MSEIISTKSFSLTAFALSRNPAAFLTEHFTAQLTELIGAVCSVAPNSKADDVTVTMSVEVKE